MIWSLKYWIDTYKTSRQPLLRTNYINDDITKQKIDFLLTDPFDLKAKHNVSDVTLLNLAGGIPVQNFQDAYFRGYSVNEDIFKTEFMYDFGVGKWTGKNLYGRVMRTIDFARKQIYNDEVQLQSKGSGFGTRLFINQIIETRALGFLLLKMQAAGGSDYPPGNEWDGYKVWTKYGYTMLPYHQQKYDDWRKTRNLEQKTLNELYWKGDYSIWVREGFSWDGIFDLRDKSQSMIYLKRYLASRHINVKLNPFASL